MIAPEIIAYIKTEQAKATSSQVIRANLLANGWSNADIDQALLYISKPESTQIPLSEKELHAYRTKRSIITFFVLAVIDYLIILYSGGRGLFGVTVFSVIVRIIVIALISVFSSKNARPEENMAKSIVGTIGKTIGAIILAFGIMFGIFFMYCLFAGGRGL